MEGSPAATTNKRLESKHIPFRAPGFTHVEKHSDRPAPARKRREKINKKSLSRSRRSTTPESLLCSNHPEVPEHAVQPPRRPVPRRRWSTGWVCPEEVPWRWDGPLMLPAVVLKQRSTARACDLRFSMWTR